ncbi:MAG: DNA-formamidopyrimidine glycosylase family protein, partial [Bacillota bacterium]|nr:DNA-formamidopyrimidine glycosylase family protein [Bacillota bacterium]
MPELPEVETVVTTLRPKLIERAITGVDVFLPKMIKFCDVDELRHEAIGQKILDITRRGKYFIISITNNWLIVGHLRMTGRLTVGEKVN